MALALYSLTSLLLFGLPLLDSLGSEVVGPNDVEPSVFVWFLAWWPHALAHGENLFQTSALFAPEGYNLAWAPAIPGPSLLLAPVTLTAGPVVAYNLLVLACPALSAWTAFILCRHLVKRTAPALAAGYLFGFSAYVIADLQGVPNLAMAALLPLLAYLVVRHVEGSLRTPWFVGLGAAALVVQFLTSPELFATATVFGVVGWLGAVWLMPDRRPALYGTAKACALSYAIAVVVLAPYLYFMFFEPAIRPRHAIPEDYSADLLSYLFPGPDQWLGNQRFASLAATFGGQLGGTGGGPRAYLGLPLLAIVAAFALGSWRRASTRWLVAAFGFLALAALGPRLHVAGVSTMPLPWEPITHLPLLRYAIPASFAVYTALVASVIAALWLADRPNLGRWALVGAAIVFLVPAVGGSRWHAAARTPALFAGSDYKRHIAREDRVFAVPFVGGGQRWQARTGMAFDLSGGYIGSTPQRFLDTYARLAAAVDSPSPAATAEVRRLLAGLGVTVIVVSDDLDDPRFAALFDAVAGHPALRTGGVRLWRLRPAP